MAYIFITVTRSFVRLVPRGVSFLIRDGDLYRAG